MSGWARRSLDSTSSLIGSLNRSMCCFATRGVSLLPVYLERGPSLNEPSEPDQLISAINVPYGAAQAFSPQ